MTEEEVFDKAISQIKGTNHNKPLAKSRAEQRKPPVVSLMFVPLVIQISIKTIIHKAEECSFWQEIQAAGISPQDCLLSFQLLQQLRDDFIFRYCCDFSGVAVDVRLVFCSANSYISVGGFSRAVDNAAHHSDT